jgi:hypothetical protein
MLSTLQNRKVVLAFKSQKKPVLENIDVECF